MSGKRRAYLIVMGTGMALVGYRCLVNGMVGAFCGLLGVEPEN